VTKFSQVQLWFAKKATYAIKKYEPIRL